MRQILSSCNYRNFGFDALGAWGCLLFTLLACGDPSPDESGVTAGVGEMETFSERLTEVDTLILRTGTFFQEIISQGKVVSRKKIEVPFTAQGIITEVAVRDGQYAREGEVLARLDDFLVRNQLKKLEVQLEQARLNIGNRYINLGYDPEDVDAIPAEIRKNTAIEYNLGSLEIERERLEHELSSRVIRAPFSGTVTGLRINEGAHSSAYPKVCDLIDNRSLALRFPILESDIVRVKTGQEILVRPMFQGTEEMSGSGRITFISPTVSGNGMVECEALPGKGNIPYRDGMRVNVHIRQAIPDVLVLPKTAVVDRQNRLVVFTLSADNRAYWNYVELGGENSDAYLIREGLEAGDTIIVNHNFDLAHLEKVVVSGELN